MRAAPAYIQKAVRAYDPMLGIEWDEREAVWYLTCEGVRLFSLDHADGTPVRNLDGHGTELLATIRRCDQRWQNREVRRRLRTARARAQARQREGSAAALAEATVAARDVARFIKQGPTPRTGRAFQGVTKR